MKCPTCAGEGHVHVPPQTISERIRYLRRLAGLTLEEAAQRADLSFRGLTRIESGQIDMPQRATLKGLASAFGITVDDLLDGVHADQVAA